MQAAPGLTLVGLGGTVRQLARIDQKLKLYPLDKVHAYILTRDAIEAIIELLAVRNRREREQVPGLKGDRADVTLAGAVIISQLMTQSRFTNLLVSGHGLREGLFYANFLNDTNPPLLPNPREFSVYSLARTSQYEEEHAENVARHSLSLFDQLAALHGHGTWERELLRYAAILHDIGVQVGYYDHHKHSAYLVLNGSLLGFSHREIALIAYLVRNHRKGLADIDEYKAVLTSSDALRIEQLSALLRIAEYLERSKSGVVRRLRVHIAPELITVAVEAVGDATVEIWDTNRRTSLFERAFGRSIRIVEGML
ncbi:HD domain-containing protein [Candidatus Gracilibacteria bacterium]|nr:HD domain-containing protein [Candidatus Gracilibacteria bacterium]